MFENIFNFELKRTAKQAFGFYLAFLILITVAIMVVVGILSLAFPSNFQDGLKIGSLLGTLSTSLISIQIIRKKRMFTFGYILMVMIGVFFNIFGGCIVGLIPISYITTKESNTLNKNLKYDV